jgi:uncharacterized integral membrane protein (TIGR00698 family)
MHPDPRILFLLGLLIAASGFVSPPVALVGGILFGCLVAHPYKAESSALARLLLQVSVVALGFGMNFGQVIRAGKAGFAYTALSIAGAMLAGSLLGRMLRVTGRASFLITAGTAICGGSAIAAIAPIAQATEEEISISMGTIFLLNAVALLAFPAIGSALHLTQSQFGLWAALAIHDTSSVVGASAKYGDQALAIATTVKLARALWIVPVSLLTAMFVARKGHAQAGASVKSVAIPWFILLFLAAAMLRSELPRFTGIYSGLQHLGHTGLTATLFLIGTGLSRKTLRQVGVRPLLQGVILWVIVAGLSLAAIRAGLIHL